MALRHFLDRLYVGAGSVAACCLVIILLIIVAQMVARWTGVAFPGSTAYAGYFMASASFLGFAYALNADAHIRVSIFLNALGKRRYWLELWCFAIGTAATCWLAYHAVEHTYGSYRWNDISQEQDKLPLWIPQLPMAIGAILLAVSFVDNLVTLILTRNHNLSGEKFTGPEV